MIPKILHRIRLGNDVLPPEAAYYELLWKQLHLPQDYGIRVRDASGRLRGR